MVLFVIYITINIYNTFFGEIGHPTKQPKPATMQCGLCNIPINPMVSIQYTSGGKNGRKAGYSIVKLTNRERY